MSVKNMQNIKRNASQLAATCKKYSKKVKIPLKNECVCGMICKYRKNQRDFE